MGNIKKNFNGAFGLNDEWADKSCISLRGRQKWERDKHEKYTTGWKLNCITGVNLQLI